MWLKYLHIACAVLSVSGYFLRGLWMMQDSPRLQARWVRVVPHIIDTLLLVSAIALTIRLQQYPFVHDWLTAKVLALLAYIVLGAIGLKYGRTRKIRVIAWAAALLTFAYLVAVALTRQPLPFLASV
ncbi:MAG: regulator SirB [Candidatus Muproteobacteria bacterium RBG_16_64_10]|uniref:Regulator SirB n=1 Tax=Candidatus Muproteobacteria bacterium RBG_16_64_10 TaxID=1817757 RepID=A0A1F6T2U2_9PROT|nr:MAG: regulator SirB [Candidatus Muproteobacteria bacterium RBG_16_64_10]